MRRMNCCPGALWGISIAADHFRAFVEALFHDRPTKPDPDRAEYFRGFHDHRRTIEAGDLLAAHLGGLPPSKTMSRPASAITPLTMVWTWRSAMSPRLFTLPPAPVGTDTSMLSAKTSHHWSKVRLDARQRAYAEVTPLL